MLVNRTHFSLLEAVSKPKELVQKAKELGYTACSINDYGSISGCVEFYNACKKEGIKPLLGTDFFVDKRWLTVIAKNKEGWNQIVKYTSLANRQFKNGRPTLSFDDLPKTNNWIIINGHQGSYPNLDLLKTKFSDIYSPHSKPIAICNSHYLNKTDRDLHNIILCVKYKLTLDQLKDFPETSRFYYNDNFFFKHRDELKRDGACEESLRNMKEVEDKCEEYDILSEPRLPKFPCPDNLTASQYMIQLCREGYRKKILETEKHRQAKIYSDRIKEEEDIFNTANLADYFLIMADMLNYIKEHGGIIGAARGSAAGCLISYLLDITDIDPIEHGLLLERFFNKGRMSEGHISLPDIDSDIPKYMREEVIDYLKDKYGHNKVGHIVTYQTMMGRNALKSVFRAHNSVSFDEMNRITQNIYDKAKIADKLQEMEHPSVILWALENMPEKFVEWCRLNDYGEIEGDYAKEFKLAIELEGTKVAQSKHAAGIIISTEPLEKVCPMIYDNKDKQQIIGWEYIDAEATGLMKCDILGLSTLDRMIDIAELVNI